MTDQSRRAAAFRDLHRQGGLILPNCWDAASARVFASSGFPAVATTSAGVAWARGGRDGEDLDRAAMINEIAVIARAIDLPLNADVEAGYGPAPADAAETGRMAWEAGAVGVNFEDADYAHPGALADIDAQQQRIAALREAAPELVVNARTDVYLLGIGGPISLMAGPTAPPAKALFEAGACRISTGPFPMRAMLDRLKTLSDGLADDWSVMRPAGDGLSKIGVVFG